LLSDPITFLPRPVAYSLPLKIDGREEGLWLGAGNAGTGTPPATEWWGWGGLCTSPIDCDLMNEAGIDHEGGVVFWAASHSQLGVQPGSTIEIGAANGGVASSFPWPVPPRSDGTGALSTWDRIPGVKLSGEVRLGITPAGTPPGDVEYSVRATLGSAPADSLDPRSWSAELTLPTQPGTYTLHARTCWGLLTTLTCEHRSTDITV
jgi:hypothetical protein